MTHILPWLVVTLSAFLASAPAFALPPELVEHAKRATALVELPGDGDGGGGGHKSFGSAFCVDAAGLFVTNAHVVDAARAGSIKLVLSPGEKDQRVVEAAVLKSDKDLDLALLRTTDATPTPALKLGRADALFDTMEVTAFGYPFGGGLALDEGAYPSVSVNTGRVTSLRKKAGELHLIQLDAALNPGNSGGPVLDPAGKVVGVVRSGLPGAGINFAIPVSRLGKLLPEPLVLVTPETIAYEARAKEHEVTVKVVSLTTPAPQYAVELTVKPEGDGEGRTFRAKAADGAATFKLVPVPPPAAGNGGGGKLVRISAEFDDGSVVGRAADRTLKVGGQAVELRVVSRIERREDGTWAVATTFGKQFTGPLTGLEDVTLMLGGSAKAAAVDLTRAASVTVEGGGDGTTPVGWLAYTAAVKADGKAGPVASADGVIELAGAPPGAAGPPPPREPVRVAAERGWQPAMRVRKGDVLVFKAEGRWSVWKGFGPDWVVGPDGLANNIGEHRVVPELPSGALLGRVGGGKPFLVGKGPTRVKADADGELEFRMNKDDQHLHDNEGAVLVTIGRR